MKNGKYLLTFLITIGFLIPNTTHAARKDKGDLSEHAEELNEKDLKALSDYLRSRREVEQKDQPNRLKITGDVRTEWSSYTEVYNGIQLRGGDAVDCDGLPVSKNDFDIEANVRFEYFTDRTRAVVHWQYDNSAGVSNNHCCCDVKEINKIENEKERKKALKKCTHDRFHGSGAGGDLNLKRAFIEYNAWKGCDGLARFDIELGRRRLYDVFESDIEFLSRMDGIVFKYLDSWKNVADFYAKWGGFLVDERVNHFAWAAEVGVRNICDTGLLVKYSFIDWNKRGRNRCGNRDPDGFKYRISQVLFDYFLDEKLFCMPAEVYAAVLYNHQATTHGSAKDGWGGYLGVILNKVRKEGDWSVELTYQYVKKHAVPFDDESGIGLGNFREDCCDGLFPPTTGYQGVLFELLYAITDNLTIDMQIEAAKSTQDRRHTYSKFELETIYAF